MISENTLCPSCDACAGKFCGKGDFGKAPKNCPSLSAGIKESLERYAPEELPAFINAARVEQAGYLEQTRVEETMEYARRCGYKRLGVAFCLGLAAEAEIFCRILRSNGFEAVSVCCKNGGVSKTELGLRDDELIRRGESFEAMCNPAGQAHFLDEAGCELAVVLGLCVGHDTVFFRHIKAPVTVLSTKDRVTGHNALAPLYAGSYYQRLYHHQFRCENLDFLLPETV